MGIFSKVWKGIKNGVKKIARGIKKVVKKVGAAFGKLGIVGQIGLMFLMPYAMNGLGTFWKGFGNFANKLATSQGVGSQIFGKALSAVHTAGSMVGRVYTGITETINSAVDVVTGKGSLGNLKDSASSIFSGPTDEARSLFSGDKFTNYTKEQSLLSTPKIPTVSVDEVKLPTIAETINKGKPTVEIASVDLPITPEQKSLGTKIVDYGKDQVAGLKTAITEFNIGEEIVGGATAGIKQRVASEIVNERDPVYNSTNISIPSYMGAISKDASMFDSVDFAVQQQVGNPWATRSLQTYDYLQSGLLQDETSWFHNRQYAANIAGGNN
tara:strand:+ start:20 stop:997 length:978 start_codon:yes stop_codon:yes gene_type:complete